MGFLFNTGDFEMNKEYFYGNIVIEKSENGLIVFQFIETQEGKDKIFLIWSNWLELFY